MDKVREVALKALYKIDKEEGYSNIVVKDMIKQNKEVLNQKDIAFISEIVYGTVTWKLTIDEIISKYSSVKLKKISSWVLNILRLGIYQIVFLSKVPKSAAVNESVELTKKYGRKSVGFVNAILRKVEKQDYIDFDNIEETNKRLSIKYSMPMWIIEELLKEKNIQTVEEICKNSNIRPKVTIRVNRIVTTKEELVETLEEKGIECQEGILEDFINISNVRNIEELEEFQEGKFTVQDEVAGLASYLLEAKKGQTVLDACSAPGGKVTYIAELMENEGEIYAFDIHAHRAQLVDQNAKRLKINIIKTIVEDMTIEKEEYHEKFDKILLDVPCLGIGVLKRKPDIKWKKKKEDIEEIVGIQKQILQVASKYLKKEGTLIYSTCSIFKEENEKIIEEFIAKNPNFEKIEFSIQIPVWLRKFKQSQGEINVYQNENTDGFYITKLKKQ